MTDQPHLSPDSARRRRWVAAVVLLAAAGALVGAVYGIGSAIRNPDAAACRPAVELARRIAPLARGEVAAVAVAGKPLRLPDLTFNDADGRSRDALTGVELPGLSVNALTVEPWWSVFHQSTEK